MIVLVLIALFTLAAAAAALLQRRLIRAVLTLIGAWAGIAAFYLWAGAELLSFAHLLIYVGAVSMVALFAVLLTRPADPPKAPANIPALALGVALAVFAILAAAVARSPSPETAARAKDLSVAEVGVALTGRRAPALLAAGVLLTAALIGAASVAGPGSGPERP